VIYITINPPYASIIYTNTLDYAQKVKRFLMVRRSLSPMPFHQRILFSAVGLFLLLAGYAIWPSAEPIDIKTASGAALEQEARKRLADGNEAAAAPLVDAALKRYAAQRDRSSVLKALELNAAVAKQSGNPGKAENILERGVQLAEASRDVGLRGLALRYQARYFIEQKAWNKVGVSYRGAYADLLSSNNAHEAGLLALELADGLVESGALTPSTRQIAAGAYEQAQTAFRIAGSDFHRAIVFERTGDLLREANPAYAQEQYFQAIQLFRQLRRDTLVTKVQEKSASMPLQLDRR
jgi:tetratricopeptide (TPR) repeat protein